MKGKWVEPDVRDAIVDFVGHWKGKTGLTIKRLTGEIGLSQPKFSSWKERYGKENEHNRMIPRDHWLEDGEVQAILDGYRTSGNGLQATDL